MHEHAVEPAPERCHFQSYSPLHYCAISCFTIFMNAETLCIRRICAAFSASTRSSRPAARHASQCLRILCLLLPLEKFYPPQNGIVRPQFQMVRIRVRYSFFPEARRMPPSSSWTSRCLYKAPSAFLKFFLLHPKAS